MARIRILPDALADQIAAGEVVERPASVVKELLENAIDAGAETITVEVVEGGTREIRVTDDGEGMVAEDAVLAIRRHATSKIHELSDLAAISTLGFRGEALPSIASVSHFELLSRPRDAVAGTRVTTDGGAEPTVEDIGCAPGTSVRVRDLFYNVPARRKFMKSKGTESARIMEVCRDVALAYPSLRLTVHRDGRRGFSVLPAKSRLERARMLVDRVQLSAIEGTRSEVRVEAMLAPPEQARSGAGGLSLFVNHRPIKDRALARAVAFAYGSVLPPGRYPIGVVHVDLHPSLVDVNAHPQKSEVRFQDARMVLDAITRVLASGLGTSAWSGPGARGADYWGERLGGAPAAATLHVAEDLDGGAADPWGLLGGATTPPFVTPKSNDAPASSLLGESGFFSSLRVLGQARKMLIICEGHDGLHIIDQHAADERVRYDGLRRTFQRREVAVQRLLVPERVEVTERDAELVEERRDDLAAVGLDAVRIGESTVAVHGVPALVRRAAPERLLRDLLAELSREGGRAFGDAVDMALATMACHGAVRAGDPLSPEECRALLGAMDAVSDFGGHCPHGRPVVHSVPFSELERRLGR